jgi:diaminopimelate decarboxylase
LHCEEVPVAKICQRVGTPVFIYSQRTLERHFRVFKEPFESIDNIVCYSVKACSNIAILRVFSRMGAGMDIVSGGELFRALKAQADPSKIVFSGVGKTPEEIDQALSAQILMFNVESAAELEVIASRAKALNKRASVAIRVNPDVDPKTLPKISTGLKKNKFGVHVDAALDLYRRAKVLENVEPIGVDCHIGSQLTDVQPFLMAIEKLKDLIGELRVEGIDIRYLDIGGGLGIPYDAEEPPPPSEYGRSVVDAIRDLGVTLLTEPGRVITGNAGIMVTKVLYIKQGVDKLFVIVDAGMNDLIRPSLYEAHHTLKPVKRTDVGEEQWSEVDVVGPICETTDYLARRRKTPPLESGDLLAVMSAGAYGFSMASNYNSRPKPAEVLTHGDDFTVIREREDYDDLVRGEMIPRAMS